MALIYPAEIYRSEERLIYLDEPLMLGLPYVRIGLISDSSRVANQLSSVCAGPFRHVIAYISVKLNLGLRYRLHRVAYLAVGGPGLDGVDPDRESDTLAVPSSFQPGQVETIAPSKFGLPAGDPLRHRWQLQYAKLQASWRRHYELLGRAPLTSSVEVYPRDYTDPIY